MVVEQLQHLKLIWAQIMDKIKARSDFSPNRIHSLNFFSFECDTSDIIMFWEKDQNMKRRSKLSGNIAGFETHPSLTVTEIELQQTFGSRLLEKSGQYPEYPRVTCGWDSHGLLEGVRVELDALTSVVYPRCDDYWAHAVDLFLDKPYFLPLQVVEGMDLFGATVRMKIDPDEMTREIMFKSRLIDFAKDCGVRLEN